MVRVGFTRPSTNPSWIPSASDNGSPRAKARPEVTTAAPPAPGLPVDEVEGPDLVVRGPHRPQLRTRGRHLGEGGGGRARAHTYRCPSAAPPGAAGSGPRAGRSPVVPNRAGGDTERTQAQDQVASLLREGLPR